MTRFVQPEKIEIDANERAVNEKSPYCFFVCTTFDSFLNDLEKNENDMPMLVKESSQNYPSISNSITDPGEAVAVLNQALQLDRKMEEHFCLIAMRSKKVIGIFKVNVGTINNSLVNTAGIFTRLLLCGATHFIIAHNHPSGNVSPSPEDEKVTENIKKISEMMGIIFCDHIIIGSGYFSFLEQNML